MNQLGKSPPHDSARLHVTGEAQYIDDFPPLRNELWVDFVGSPFAHGRIKAIDASAAAAIEGIVAILTHANVPAHNTFGPIFHDEELLAVSECHYLGQPIVLLAGTSRDVLTAARQAVRLEVEELPAIHLHPPAAKRGPATRPDEGPK